jgi:hypothetical protein
VQGVAQSAQPDVVGVGATKKYYVQATSGSSYEWRINGGVPELSTTNSLEVNWTKAGIYTLTVQETTKYNDDNKSPREVFSGHYVPVQPTPIKNPIYISHSETFFKELGFSENLLDSDDFIKMFSANTQNTGWTTGYALSIYGTEYYAQCPFQTGNGYGDGRAISILEAVINGKRLRCNR